jgi:hypothetical protein
LAPLFAFVLACGSDPAKDAGSDSDSDVDGDVDVDEDVDVDTDTDVDVDADADTDSDTTQCAPDDEESPAAVIGAGETEYSDVECEGQLEIFYGEQGCCHFYGAVREIGVPLEPWTTIDWLVVTDGGETVTEWGYVQLLVGPDSWIDLADGWKASLHHMVIMTLDEPADVTEQGLNVSMHLTTNDGTEYSDTHRIRVFYGG